MDGIEKTLSSKYHFKGKIMNLREDQVEVLGRKTTREVCEHCDGVAVLPITDDGEVILVSQYRYPFGLEILEAPAGKVEPGEPHFDCGVRELSEETGYSADDMQYLGFVYPSPGCMTERIHLYLARSLHEGESHPDEGEVVQVRKYKLSDALKMCDEGKIDDAKTAVLLLRAARILGI
ncbi:MAG: NUDIX hydrolase [Oscillospiraceae bacterium]|nr:NUDIX hydrolase [Oscillospiraceae bacterium]